MFRVGQLAVNIDEGTTHQIRHKFRMVSRCWGLVESGSHGVLQNIIESIRRWRDGK